MTHQHLLRRKRWQLRAGCSFNQNGYCKLLNNGCCNISVSVIRSGHLLIKMRAKSNTKIQRLFSTIDWLWQKFSQTLQCIKVCHKGGDARQVSPLASVESDVSLLSQLAVNRFHHL